MKFRQPPVRGIHSFPRLSLVAFIDIVLFLLLYLMLAGSLAPAEARLSSGLEKPAPAAGKAPDLPPISLRVERRAEHVSYRIGQRQFESADALVLALAQSPKSGGVIVHAGEGAVVGDVASALQAAKDSGFDRVSYAPTP